MSAAPSVGAVMSASQRSLAPVSGEPVYRDFTFGVTRAVRHLSGDISYLRCDQALLPFPQRMTERLLFWASTTPNQPLYAQRDPARGGAWRTLSFGQALQAARSVGQALLDRGLNADRPLVILSENSLEHAQLALGAMYAGVPFCAVSPAYSLVSQDFAKLRHVMSTLTPGLVYCADWERFRRPIEAVTQPDMEVVVNKPPLVAQAAGRRLTPLSDLLATAATPGLEAAMLATGPDSIVKFLFTSGSTRAPLAVVNTQRMICANQQQLRQSIPFLAQEPPVLVDWLPWNHTAGGNHNFFMVLFNGGTLYIDEGKPTPELIGETLRNLREVAPTWFFNVPVGYEAMVRAMDTDQLLRRNFFSRLRQMLYSGAALSQPIQDALYAHAEREWGKRIVMTAGLGMTESSPFALFVTTAQARAGHVGLPAAGLEVKLVPLGDKQEIRYRGPNITPGYWRNPEATREAFDEEGYFRTGDAVAWIAPDNIHLGLRFDGRIAEDFKLSTGTFVSVGPLRARIIAAGAPYLQDVVLTGLNMNEVGALLLPTPALRGLADLPLDAPWRDVVASAPVMAWLQELVDRLARSATGSANRVARALLLTEPPSLDNGEVTDKGSVNQRAVLKQRAALVAALHAGQAPHVVLPQV
jgi:feruloyl-CoA synthase